MGINLTDRDMKPPDDRREYLKGLFHHGVRRWVKIKVADETDAQAIGVMPRTVGPLDIFRATYKHLKIGPDALNAVVVPDIIPATLVYMISPDG